MMSKLLNAIGNYLSKRILLPLTWMDSKWADEEIPKAHKQSVALLSLIYFCQLFIHKYKDFFEITDTELKYHAKLLLFAGTIVGALVAYYLLRRFRIKGNTKSIRRLILWGNLILTIVFVLYSAYFEKIKDLKNCLYLFNFLLGFFNAAFIGLAITWICESLFKHLRTTGTLYVGLCGFLGAATASALHSKLSLSLTATYTLFFILFITPFLIVYLKDEILIDSKLVTTFFKSEEKENGFWQAVKEVKKNANDYKKEIFFSLILGMIVQYWVFWASKAYLLFQQSTTEKELEAPFFRYIGAVIGSALLIRWYQQKKDSFLLTQLLKNASIRRRDTVLFIALFLTVVLNFYFLWDVNGSSVKQFWTNCELYYFNTLVGLIGIISCIWTLSILHVAEQFNLVLRPFMIMLVPNVYRASEMILLWRTHDNLDYTAVHTWGIMFGVLGIAAILALKRNNFEADVLDAAVDKDGKIDAAQILADIHDKSEEEKLFFVEANNAISDHLKDNEVEMKFYLSAIYYKSNNQITHSEYENQEKVLACYSTINIKDIKNAHQISTNLVASGHHESYIEYLFKKAKQENSDEKKLHGGLMFRPGRAGRKTRNVDFKHFNLDVIDLNDHIPENLIDARTAILNNQEAFFDKGEKINKLNQTFELFATDASFYDPDAYFLYLILPISKEPRAMFVIKTADELSEDNLRRLQHLISAVQGKWDEASKGEEYKRLQALQSSSLVSHFQKNMVRSFADYITQCTKDNIPTSDVTEQIATLFTEYMNIYKPTISIATEKELLQKYTLVHLLMGYRKVKDKNLLEVINNYNKKIPSNWIFEIDEDLYSKAIPRGILQPMIENMFKHSGYDASEFSELSLTLIIKSQENDTIIINLSNKCKNKVDVNAIRQKLKEFVGTSRSLHLIQKTINYHNKVALESNDYFKVTPFEKDILSFEITLKNCTLYEHKEKNAIISNDEKTEKRPSGLSQKNIFVIDDNKADFNEINDILDNDFIEEMELKLTAQNYEEAEEKIKKMNDIQLIISDLSLSDDINNRDKWSTNILYGLDEKDLKNRKIGIIILSNASDHQNEVEANLKQKFPKSFLGFSKKFENTKKDIDSFLDIYYNNFEK